MSFLCGWSVWVLCHFQFPFLGSLGFHLWLKHCCEDSNATQRGLECLVESFGADGFVRVVDGNCQVKAQFFVGLIAALLFVVLWQTRLGETLRKAVVFEQDGYLSPLYHKTYQQGWACLNLEHSNQFLWDFHREFGVGFVVFFVVLSCSPCFWWSAQPSTHFTALRVFVWT